MSKKLLQLAEKAVKKRKEAYKIRMYVDASMGVDLDTCIVVYSPGQTHKVNPEKMETYLNTSIEMSIMLIDSVKTKTFDNQEYQAYKDILLDCVLEAMTTPDAEFPVDETEVEKDFDEGNEEGLPGGLPDDVKPVENQMDAEEKTIVPIEEEEVEMFEGEPILGRVNLKKKGKNEELILTKYSMIELLEKCKTKKAFNDFLELFRGAGIDEEIILEVEALTTN